MDNPVSPVDPDGLIEYSVVFTDRSLNHMSKAFQAVMVDLSSTLKTVYNADALALVPGGGTYAMEAVARQLGTGAKCMVLRNGWFSYRWSQIFAAGSIPSEEHVLKAKPQGDGAQAPFAPPAIETVVEVIRAERPDIVFAPHVETSAGMILPDDYLREVGKAVRAVGGLFVLDCIASGTIWVDMADNLVDVLISAPQKGWSATPCAGVVMMNGRAKDRVEATDSTSFAVDLKKWLQIMATYEGGGHAYHATMPTDGLRQFRDAMNETSVVGFDAIKRAQQSLGDRVRVALVSKGFESVAATGFQAPGVVVSYTTDPELKNGKKFAAAGLQIAAGVPLQIGEPADFSTFRIGLFGLDKLRNIDRTVQTLESALERL